MTHYRYHDGLDFESDDLPPALSSRLEQLSRKWAEEERERRSRPSRRTRRRIEDWREARSLARQFDVDLDD
jgi:hypothetical protein